MQTKQQAAMQKADHLKDGEAPILKTLDERFINALDALEAEAIKLRKHLFNIYDPQEPAEDAREGELKAISPTDFVSCYKQHLQTLEYITIHVRESNALITKLV